MVVLLWTSFSRRFISHLDTRLAFGARCHILNLSSLIRKGSVLLNISRHDMQIKKVQPKGITSAHVESFI